ncbi:hypothetical protein V490_00125 [Pseudogymnoascus sp. VKM F-3557]|nr:hypothetical protein V490_00125 [Pseudogymnoascus sp. VKM F-3557]
MAQFLDRYRIIEAQKEDSVTFIKDLLVYIDKLENDLRGENQRLLKELEDAHLDLDDARRSRREMQQQLTATSQQLGQYNTDNESLKVLQLTLPLWSRPLAHNNRTEIPT